jgi:hypothetical protein
MSPASRGIGNQDAFISLGYFTVIRAGLDLESGLKNGLVIL